MSAKIEAGTLPRRRPRRKGVHQTLSESEIDGVIAMLRSGVSALEIRHAYDVGLAAIRAGLKTRGLTMSQVRLQVPLPPRPDDRRVSVTCSATPVEYQTIRAYAVQHGMTVSQVLRRALHAVGVLDTA